MRRLCCMSVLAVAALGCGGGKSGGVDGKVAQLAAEEDRIVAFACECFDDEGYESRSACVDDNKTTSGEVRCVANALEDEDEDDALAYLDCMIRYERAYLKCVADEKLTCNDSDDTCDSAGDDADCEAGITRPTRTAIQDCLSDDEEE